MQLKSHAIMQMTTILYSNQTLHFTKRSPKKWAAFFVKIFSGHKDSVTGFGSLFYLLLILFEK